MAKTTLTYDYSKVSYNFAEMLAKRGLPAHDMTAETLKELGLAPVLDFYSPTADPGKKSPREMNTQALISAYNAGYAKGDLTSFFQTLALFSKDFSPKKETSAFQTYVNGKLPIKDIIDGTFTTFAGKFDSMEGILKLVEKGKVTPSIVTQLFAEVAYSADRFRKTEYSREYMTKAQGSLLSSFAVPDATATVPEGLDADGQAAFRLGVKPEMYKALKAVLPATEIANYVGALRGNCDLSAARDVKPGAKDTPFEMKSAHPTAYTDGDMSRVEIAAKTATSILYLPQVQAVLEGRTSFDFGGVEIGLQDDIKGLYYLQPNDKQETVEARIGYMANTLKEVVAGVPEAERAGLLATLTQQAASHGLFAAKTAEEFCYGLGEMVLKNPTILPEPVREMGALAYDRTQILEITESGGYAFKKPNEDGTYNISVDGKIFYNGTIVTIPYGVPATATTIDAGDGKVKMGPATSKLDQARFDSIVDQLIRESKLPPYAKDELRIEDIAVLENGSNPVMTAITQKFQDASQSRTAGFDQEASEGSMSEPGGASRHDGLSSFDVSLYRSTTYYKQQKEAFSQTIGRYKLLDDYTFIPGEVYSASADAFKAPEAATQYNAGEAATSVEQ